MMASTLHVMLENEYDYAKAAIARATDMRDMAEQYDHDATIAYSAREERRRQDAVQWKNIILPSIQKRAMLSHMA